MTVTPLRKARPKVLWICGNHNHNTMLHKVSQQMPECDHWFTPYYCDKWTPLDVLRRLRCVEFVALGYGFRDKCLRYLEENGLSIDLEGQRGDYDLVVTCSDLLVPSNVTDKPLVGIQEGMIDPLLLFYRLRQKLPWLPRWAAGTACTGLSGMYDRYCVASDLYVDEFAGRDAPRDRLVATGIPNFDDFASYVDPDHWINGHVLACTSDGRETFRRDDRKAFILRCVELADGRPLVFKFHPNERMRRAVAEVRRWAPGARCVMRGYGETLAANCEVLITEWSTLAFVGLVLGIETHSYRDLDDMARLLPAQHGHAAVNIAEVCREVIAERGGATRAARIETLRRMPRLYRVAGGGA